MVVGETRDLRQVSDDKHLALGSECLQPEPDLDRRLSANAGIHLVEDKRWKLIRFGACRADCKHDT